MKQNADFHYVDSQALSTTTPLPTLKFLTTNESFQMRYYVRIFLKGHENCQGLKLKVLKNSLFIK